MAGDGVGGHGQFQLTVRVSGASFQLDRVFVEVFHTSPEDGSELDRVIVPAVLGPKIVPGYTTHYGSGNLYYRLVAANPHTIPNPNLIHPRDVVRVPRD